MWVLLMRSWIELHSLNIVSAQRHSGTNTEKGTNNLTEILLHMKVCCIELIIRLAKSVQKLSFELLLLARSGRSPSQI